MDFATNSGLLEELREHLNDAITTIIEEEGLIFSGITDLKESWDGQSYEAFREKCETYRPAMNSLISILEAYKDMIDKVIVESDQLVSDIATQLHI